MKKYFLGFLAGIFFIIAVLLLIFYLMSGKHVVTNLSENNFSCLSWPRIGLMSKEENEIFQKLDFACRNDNLENINQYYFVSESSVEVKCFSDSNFREPNYPIMDLIVKNISKREIYLLDHSWSALIENTLGVDGYYLAPETKSNFIKILQPGDTTVFRISPNLKGYGDYKFDLFFGGYKMISKKSGNYSTKRKWAINDTCEFNWSP